MLAEMAEYMVTPCQSWARRAGFLYQMVALRARFRRNKGAWQSHISSCHDLVIEVARTTRRKDRAIVFGSGLLIETPIKYLAETFQEVILVDAVHGLPERWQMRRLPNVKIVSADVTGLINKTPCARSQMFSIAQMTEVFDLAISSNLLSTIPLFLHNSQGKEPIACGWAELSRQAIVDHMINIQEISNKYCLIADFEHLVIDDGLRIERMPLLGCAMLPPPCKTWTWNIALRPEIFKNKDVYSRVGAWCNHEDT